MRLYLFLSFVIISFCLNAQDKYIISLDLKKVVKDRVKVTVNTPQVTSPTVEYIIPAVIPGSYSKKDYGRFIIGLRAFTTKGGKLKVKKKGNNVFVISNNKRSKLARLEYWVDDTWDAGADNKMNEDSLNYVFQPGGTNIEAGKNYVINHFGFYGYLEGYKMLPYEINITKPAELYGSTALEIKRETKEKDILYAKDYVRLADSPLMYSVPDTASFLSGDARIYISVFSENKVVNAEAVKKYITPLGSALNNFFVQMPVDRYYFIMYFPAYSNQSGITKYGGFGALEHSYSSFYFLPELDNEASLKSMILGVVSHEFLHILTPLNIHSEEIENFDFRDPKMSKHLWLYEGVTEYFSNLVQVRDGLMTQKEFMKQMQSKITRSTDYPVVSFTEMSKNILDEKYKDMYGNVYEKGALLGFLLDIRLMELSKGKFGLRELMMKLKEKYGPSKPFKDDELINDIVSLSYPEIKQYFADHVEGAKELPFKEYFSKIGWSYFDTKTDSVNTYGKFGFTFNEAEKQFVLTKTDKNVFGFNDNDVLLAINDEVITMDNYVEVLNPLFEVAAGKELNVKFKRNGEILTATGKPYKDTKVLKFVIEEAPNASPEQLELRKQMLSGK